MNTLLHKSSAIDRWIFRILLFYIATMPLIVFGRFEFVTSPLITEESILASGYKIEFFTHYKFMWTVLITAIVLFLFIWKVIFKNEEIRKTYVNIFCAIFIVAILVSTLFSDTVHIALYGMYDRSDGAIMWLCYVVLLFIAVQIKLPEKSVDYFLYSLIPFAVINFTMITMNFYGKDFLSFDWFYKLMTASIPELYTPDEGSQILGTLNQWNFMSGMFSMMTVMYLVWAMTSKNRINVVIGTLVAIMSMLIVFLSVSTSGFLTFTVCLVFILWIAFKQKSKQPWIVLAAFIIVCTPVYLVWNAEKPKIYNESIGGILKLLPFGDNELVVDSPPSPVSDEYLPVLPEPAVSAGSGRTYIWRKTIDLIKERPLVGYGMDTILYHFPHYNMDARGGLRSEHTLVDKPHNTYLGTFYGFGIVGFLCFVSMMVFSVVNLVKSIRLEQWATSTFLMFAFAYYVQSTFNDSLPPITPLAFIFLGVSINYIMKEHSSRLE